MPFKVSYTMVGLFVILLGGAWIGISMWLAYGDFDKDYQPYRVYIQESVSGLYVDAPVKYRGVEVGKVREIELDPQNTEQVRITMDIERDVPIKQDTRAILSVQGLTGIGFIELTGGSRDSPRLEAGFGDEYPVMGSGPSLFVRMDTMVSELITNLNGFTEDARSLLDPQLWGKIQQTMDHVQTLTKSLAERSDSLDASIGYAEILLENSAVASRKFPQLIEQVGESATAVETMAEQIGAASAGLSETVAQSGNSWASFSEETLPDIDRLVNELRALVANLDRISRRVEEEPRALLYGDALRAPGPGE